MIFLLPVYAIILIINVPGLIKRKEWRELIAFFVFYTIAFVLGLMYVLDITIPSPMKGLNCLISDLLGLKYPKY